MSKEKFDLSTIKANPDNPFPVKSEAAFKDLVQKIDRDPEFLLLRPIVVDRDTMIVLGGNKRLAALLELGKQHVPIDFVKFADDLTDDQKRRFIFADNYDVGEWDFDNYEKEDAEEWSIFYPSSDNKEIPASSFKDKLYIRVKYEREDYDFVRDSLRKISDDPATAILMLLKEKYG